MDFRSAGIVLRTRPLTETSLIVHWLTPDLGRIATVAKGARRPKSPFRGKLDLFYLCDFSFVRSRRSELHTLREATLREPHSALRKDLGRLEQAAYAGALIEQNTETETPLEGFHEMFLGFLAALASQAPQAHLVLSFELKLLVELGVHPDFSSVVMTAGCRRIVEMLMSPDWAALGLLRPTWSQVRELDVLVRGFLELNSFRVPRGRDGLLGGGGVLEAL